MSTRQDKAFDTSELDRSRSMLQQLREQHPIRVGQVIDGKRVTQTCYTFGERGEHIPVYYLEGEAYGVNAPHRA